MTPTDRITILPHLTGAHSRAWRCDLRRMRARLDVSERDDATIAWWLIEAPWAHPIWHSYLLSLAHLRPMPDQRKTLFYVGGATHELVLHALDPEGKRDLLIGGEPLGKSSVQILTPKNFAAQFIARTDAAADARVEAAVQQVCDGTLSPDTDHIRQWAELFGDNMLKNAGGRTGMLQ